MNQFWVLSLFMVNCFQLLRDSLLQRLIKPVFIVRDEIISRVNCITNVKIFQQLSCFWCNMMTFERFCYICALKFHSEMILIDLKMCTDFCSFNPILTTGMLFNKWGQIIQFVMNSPHAFSFVIFSLSLNPLPKTVHETVTSWRILFDNGRVSRNRRHLLRQNVWKVLQKIRFRVWDSGLIENEMIAFWEKSLHQLCE